MSRDAGNTRRDARRAAALVMGILVGIGAAAPSVAAVSATATGVSTKSGASAAQQIRAVETTFDSATGTWGVTVRFRGAQSPASANDLAVSLSAQGSAAIRGGWLLRTDPEDPRAAYQPWAPPVPGVGPTTEAAFDATRMVLQLRVVDPQLIGLKPDVVRVDLNRAGDTLSAASAFLGPVAPRPKIPNAARRLTVSEAGVVRVPLAPLSRPAERFIRVYTASGYRLGVGYVSKAHYRRRSVELRVPRRELRRLSTHFRPGSLTVRTGLSNTSQNVVRRSVLLRRT